ncbi:hypothetical protein [Xanthomonas phaseoli]|uniref:hypothetical protein n=1 Tax=Xanthomonas phaseoli TaxID=1985254 RepID=UPI001E3545ED|nr:hypothetical protein [Xanthomonas phaseoli]MCC8471408.1 hypothetical protein [Xanthomonas phaseoli]
MKANLSEEEKEIWLVAYKRALAYVEPSAAAYDAHKALEVYRNFMGANRLGAFDFHSNFMGGAGLMIYDMEGFLRVDLTIPG